MPILILTFPGDNHAEFVRWGLERHGVSAVKLFLPALARGAFSYRVDDGDRLTIAAGGEIHRLCDYDTIWYRRMHMPVLPDAMHAGDREAARRDWASLMRFLEQYFRYDEDVFCLNPPASRAASGSKPFQLRMARRCGLDVPATLIGNGRAEIERFIRANLAVGADTIVKPLLPALWERDDGARYALGVAVVTLEDIAAADVESAPMIYQRRLPKAFEVRLTVMGRTMIAVRLDSQAHEQARLDFRQVADWAMLGNRPIDIPPPIRRGVEALCDRLGTLFGSMDFIVGPDGTWTFLETNEMGNFLWMEYYNPEVPLLDCFVSFLKSRDPCFRYHFDESRRLARMAEIDTGPASLFQRAVSGERSSQVAGKTGYHVCE